MSKVLTQAKNRYQKAIIIESVCLVVFGVFLAIWQGESAVDFSLGFISAFVPFCAFAYIVFFRKQDFSTKFKGFDPEEVNDFLEEVKKELETLIRDNKDLEKRVKFNEEKVEYFNLYDTPEEILYSYLLQYYALNKLPKEIYIDDIDGNLLADVVDCKVIIPKRGNHRKILDTVKENATYYLNNNLAIEELKERKLQVTLNNIAEKLGVNSINSIDAFDNSNIMGVDAVSVKVNFTNGKKNTYNYRKFKIDESMGINDVQTMKEVLYRNYKDRKTNTELLIVDGGKNHLNVAIDVVHNMLGLKQIKIIGLAKNDKHITEYIITDDYEIIEFPKTSAEYLFLKDQK